MSDLQCPHCQRETRRPAGSSNGSKRASVVDCEHCDRSFSVPTAPPSAPAVDPTIDWAAAGVPTPGRRPAQSQIPTEVPVALSGGIGLLLTGLFYVLIVTPFEHTYFGQLFTARGWVPYGIAVLAGWSIVMLAFKTWRVAQQRRCFDAELLPTSIAPRIHADNAHVFASYLRQAALSLPPNFLTARLERALLHLASRRSADAVSEQLARQSEADANAVDSSYTTLRVFVWAIPILGFIGTVLGIGAAVGAFSDSVSAAVDLEVMKQSIGSVATGLGIAFDTTLLALVTSIVLMFPMSWLQKFEDSQLARVDDYCDTQLAQRLEALPADANGGNESADGIERLGASLGRSMQQLDSDLLRLSQRVGSLSDRLGGEGS